MDILNIVFGLATIISMIFTIIPGYFLLKEKRADKSQRKKISNIIISDHTQVYISQKKRRRKLKYTSIASIILFVLFLTMFFIFQLQSRIYANGNSDVNYSNGNVAGRVDSLAWSPDGKTIVAVSHDGEVHLWNTISGNSTSLNTNSAAISSVSWSPGNAQIAMISDKEIIIENINTGTLSSLEFTSTATINAMAWSPKGNYIAFGGADKTIQVWKITNKQKQLIVTYNENGMVYALAWSNDGKYIASTGDDGELHAWNAITGQNIFSYAGSLGSISTLKWSPTSDSFFASASSITSTYGDQEVRIWDTKKGYTENPAEVFTDRTGVVNGIDWSPNGNNIAIVDNNSFVYIWNVDTKSLASSYQDIIFPRGFSELTAVGWSSDGKSIAIGEDWFEEGYEGYDTVKIITYCERWCIFH